MIDIDQYILLFLKEKTKEMELFKAHIENSRSPNGEISQSEWEVLYLNWAVKQNESVIKSSKMPKIYLNED